MTNKREIPLRAAENLALALLEQLAPHCDRIEIAGSIRRRKPIVGDIELCAVPRYLPNLLGPSDTPAFAPVFTRLERDGLLTRIKNGPKYKQFHIPALGCNLDLFLTDAACWPVIFAIRTGPADFSKRLVTQRQFNGLLPNDHRVDQGRVWKYGQPEPLDFADERAFLEFTAGQWIEPEARI